ncbi:IucA/IucC family protein [Zobellella sp. DQSA1]|uniref:IucA/IucC family protein n=1 Tax=Zobellella sp. DQSA1 TaxID=3342386 RepID=UPI0035C17060
MLRQLYTDQLQKLVDALYMENLDGFCDSLLFSGAVLSVRLNDAISLGFSCRMQEGLRPYRVQDDDVRLQDERQGTRCRIPAREVMSYLVQASWWPEAGRERAVQWWQECFDFLEYLPNLLQSAHDIATSPLAASECFAMMADRPFHPFAHAKGALAQLVTDAPRLHWWALPPGSLLSKQSRPPAELLLTEEEQAALSVRLLHLAPGYVALPLLPTQHRLLLSESNTFGAVDLIFTTATGSPTSSLRTLTSVRNEGMHIKLSTSASTLGAIRSMPPRYLINGDEACHLLTQILERDSALASAITLCDEHHWWVAGREQPLVKNPGLLGCQIRFLPPLDDASSTRLLAMSALSYPHESIWPRLLGGDTSPWQAVKDLSRCFINTFLDLWCYGVMPECHGQNVLARYRHSQLHGFVLRDHDTLRVCPARLTQLGLPRPDYQIDWTTPNSLVLTSMEELLAYFTTLGLQVNLYPIALAVLRHSTRTEADFWRWVRTCLEDYAAALQDKELGRILSDSLLNARVWPFKQVLGPLLTQHGASTGMPSGMGSIRNPLLPLPTPRPLTAERVHEAS